MKISNNLKIILFSILIGSSACMIAVFAFSSPGSNQPPNGNPTFWLLNGTSMYYSNGNVGIGTTTPAYKLDVAGQIRSSSGGYVFPDGTTQTSSAGLCKFGGFYVINTFTSACVQADPTTGACSCPSGYSGFGTGQAYNQSPWDRSMVLCYSC